MRSGLVKLLDRLCSLVVDGNRSLEVGGDEDEAMHRVTSLAWAAFQVLADRCVSWETENSAVVSSGLAQQVGVAGRSHDWSCDLIAVILYVHIYMYIHCTCTIIIMYENLWHDFVNFCNLYIHN